MLLFDFRVEFRMSFGASVGGYWGECWGVNAGGNVELELAYGILYCWKLFT